MSLEITIGASWEHTVEMFSDDKVVRAMGYDGYVPSPILHPLVTTLSAWVNGEFAGLFLAIRYSKYEIELHSLLKYQFIKHSRDLGKMVVEWSFSLPDMMRVTAHIMEGQETARNYALKVGFKLEGVRRNACIKNGSPRSVYMLGITKEDWR